MKNQGVSFQVIHRTFDRVHNESRISDKIRQEGKKTSHIRPEPKKYSSQVSNLKTPKKNSPFQKVYNK